MFKEGQRELRALLDRAGAALARGQAEPPTPGQPFEQSEAVLGRLLLENVLPFWYPGSLDLASGGYRLAHDGGHWQRADTKTLIGQARMVWAFSLFAEGPSPKRREMLAAARHGYEFLRRTLWDRQHGGFFWQVSSGRPATAPEKNLLAQAYGLAALSSYASSSGDRDAGADADALFGLIDQHLRDPATSSYRAACAPDWSPIDADRRLHWGHWERHLVTTYLHLMEALTEYCLLTPDSGVAKRRLKEIVDLLVDDKLLASGFGIMEYNLDWTPVRSSRLKRTTDYGHALKAGWMLTRAAGVAGTSISRAVEVQSHLFESAFEFGYDKEHGGFSAYGRPGWPALCRDKHWWVQAEGLIASLDLYKRTGRPRYRDCFVGTLGWIVDHQADWEGGDWHRVVSERGEAVGSKADGWKTAFHNGRALVHCIGLLSDDRGVGHEYSICR